VQNKYVALQLYVQSSPNVALLIALFQKLWQYFSIFVVSVLMISVAQEYTATAEVEVADGNALVSDVLQSSRYWNYNFMPVIKIFLHLFIAGRRFESLFGRSLYVFPDIYRAHSWLDPKGWFLFLVMSNLSNFIGAAPDGLTKCCLVLPKMMAYAATGDTVFSWGFAREMACLFLFDKCGKYYMIFSAFVTSCGINTTDLKEAIEFLAMDDIAVVTHFSYSRAQMIRWNSIIGLPPGSGSVLRPEKDALLLARQQCTWRFSIVCVLEQVHRARSMFG
jgi:hypothetical protein